MSWLTKLLNLKSVFREFVTFSLLVSAVINRSPAFAWACVGALLVTLVAEAVREKLFAMKNINVVIPDDLRKRLQDTEARITAIEYTAKQRGF